MSLELESAVAKLKFVPVVERVIEGMHKDVKIAAKHVALGPSRVSMAVRLPEILRRMQQQGFKARLLELMDISRHARKAVGALNLSLHAECVKLVQAKDFQSSSWLQALVHIMHRCTLQEQFETFDASSHVRQKEKNKKRVDALHLQDRQVPRTYDAIMRRCVVEHLRMCADPSQVYSVPVEDTYSLQAFVSNAGSAEVGSSEVFDSGSTGSRHFFRVLHSQPSRLKTAPSPVALGPMFSHDALVITLHPVAANSQDNADVVLVDVNSRAVPQLTQALESCDVREKLLQWSPGNDHRVPDATGWYIRLCNPRPVCRLEDFPSLEDAVHLDTMQLILALEQQGWRWGCLPAATKARKQLVYRLGD